jgi:uncharacterized membrane protein YkgB
MAEPKKDKKDKKPEVHKGGLSFGMEILLFVLAIFIIWVLTGGMKKTTEEKPFITPLTDPVNPGTTYGPKEKRSNINYQQGTQYKPTDTVN